MASSKPNFIITGINYSKGFFDNEEYLFFTYDKVKTWISMSNSIIKYHAIMEINNHHLALIEKENAKYLDFTRNDNDIGFAANLDKLPDGILGIRLGYPYNLPLDYLPSTLKELCFQETIMINGEGCIYNHPLDNLPIGLERLLLPSEFSHTLGNLPNKLKYLDFSTNIKAKDIDNLPDSIEVLFLNKHHPPTKYPANLKKLVITPVNYQAHQEHYDQVIKPKKIDFRIRDVVYPH